MDRIQLNGTRYYVDGSNLGVSVTEFLGRVYPLSPHLKDWWIDNSREYIENELDTSSAFGTAFHDHAEAFADGHDIDLSDMGDKMAHYITSLQFFFHDRNVQPIFTERRVFHRASEQFPLSYGGTLDLECELDWNGGRVRALVDYKSGNIYDKNKFQLIAYMVARKQQDPDLDFHLFNFSPNYWRRKPTGKPKHWKYGEKDLETFKSFCTIYSNEVQRIPKTIRTFSSARCGEEPSVEDVKLWDYINDHAEKE